MTNKPVLQALVLADQVYQDRATGKMIIAGTFRQLWTKKFPSKIGRETYAYICLTDLNGTAKLELRYLNLETMEVLLKTAIEVRCDDPMSTIEFALQVPPFPMPCAGTFSFDLHCDGEMLGSLRIQVNKLEESRGG